LVHSEKKYADQDPPHQLAALRVRAPGSVEILNIAGRPYIHGMLRKQLEIPPEAAKAFVRDLKAFFKASGQLMQDEIAAKQAWLLRAAGTRLERWLNGSIESGWRPKG